MLNSYPSNAKGVCLESTYESMALRLSTVRNMDNRTEVDTRSISPQILLLLSDGYVDPIGP